ncbi:hypothetical protein PISMIDRAFT_229953 [Pisolithus microcarpus 441]|uniref:Uncharacterized protein n=1 Tax=Pisolithus microcarpus 441 TaxID=765257 RepID=A0A0C9YKU1_9AGAM|nr:hypothetical protein BKA83DRAFT_229953 [Pisolithus microcarpus]KIK17291.1 hypothetical protein PISMIDRAFT_229953 [Pisolithus microcarpus 441]
MCVGSRGDGDLDWDISRFTVLGTNRFTFAYRDWSRADSTAHVYGSLVPGTQPALYRRCKIKIDASWNQMSRQSSFHMKAEFNMHCRKLRKRRLARGKLA